MRSMLILVVLMLFGCASPTDRGGGSVPARSEREGRAVQDLVIAPGPGVALGAILFANTTFGTNGRSCATCHLPASFTISPVQADLLFGIAPTNPLFRPIDSDDGSGASYTRVRTRSTFSVEVPLASNVTISPHDADVRVGSDGVTYVALRRSTITSVNSGLNPHLMWDGREGNDLSHQALGAIRRHAQSTTATEPTQAQLDLIATFQRALFSRPELRAYARGGPAPTLPTSQADGSPLTASQARGRLAFVDGPLPGGKCAQCHSGPMLNEVNAFNIFQLAGTVFANNEVSEFNVDANPVHRYTFAIDPATHPFGLSEVTLDSPDPGRIILTGNPCEVVAACAINAFVVPFDPSSGLNVGHQTQSLFRTQTLWGINETAPYFHDHSAADLDAVLRHYQTFFHITALGTGNPAFEISDAEASDIVAFMRLL